MDSLQTIRTFVGGLKKGGGLALFLLLLSFSTAWAEPTPVEVEFTRQAVRSAFEEFLQLWQEERYFELYDWGKKQSRDGITPAEFATRMVELNWVPKGLVKEASLEVSFRFRTLIYVTATIEFRHKTNQTLHFQKRQTFLMLWEEQKWRFDLLQMLRSPFYIPPEEKP